MHLVQISKCMNKNMQVTLILIIRIVFEKFFEKQTIWQH